VQGLTSSHGVPAGYFGLGPAELASLDPLQIGPNQVMLGYFNGFPHTNDVSAGDGVNFVGFRFRGPTPTSNNWYIARADFKINRDGTHSLFWRGAVRNDLHSSVPYLPGTIPLHTFADFSKGFTVGYTAALRPTIVNSFRWGF